MGRQLLFPDTDEKTEHVLLELVRRMPGWKKLEQVADLTNTVRGLGMVGPKEAMNTTIIDVLLKVAGAFDKLGIPYVVGGSIASSLHGLARSTLDVDVLALIKPEQAVALADELKGEFYADKQAILNAVRVRRSFNAIHMESGYKVDVFVAGDSGFEAAQLNRRQESVVKSDPPRTAFFASPEDTILAKLVWYRKGNETSEQQWRDVRGIIEAKSGTLDLEYLLRWAEELGVADLLDRALGN